MKGSKYGCVFVSITVVVLAVGPSGAQAQWSGVIPAIPLGDVELFDPYDQFNLFSNSMRQLTKLADHFASHLAEPSREFVQSKTNVTHHPSKLGRMSQKGHDFYLRLLPQVDWHETAEGFVLTAATPGLRKEDLSVEVVGGPGGYYLDITGPSKKQQPAMQTSSESDTHRTADAGSNQAATDSSLIVRLSYSKFHYRVALPTGVDRESLKAKYEDGLLLLTMKPAKKETCQRHQVIIE